VGLFAQNITLLGNVSDNSTGEALVGAAVIVKGSNQGVYSGESGDFKLVLRDPEYPIELEIKYLGYTTQTIAVENPKEKIVVKMIPFVLPSEEVVITASRVSESLAESPISIEKMNARAVQSVASGDFYEALGNLKGVDIVTSSIGFKSFNTRGFNTTSPVRVVQFIDGMDNQAPGLNFPVGNLVGAVDLDIQSVEVVTGPASALYGPNAFQGVVNMQTKDAYNFPGLSVMLKGGSRSWMEGQFRYARTLDKNKKFAIKLTGAYKRVEDWEATDEVANRYGNVETELDLSSITRQLQNSDDPETAEDFTAINAYLDFYPRANPGKVDVEAPGYLETELADYQTESLKAGLNLNYKLKDSLILSYDGKLGRGTAVYQGTNRYSINNILFHQHKLQLTGKQFFVKAYTTIEDAGDSYDMVFTGINLSRAAFGDYVSEYLGAYFSTLDTLTNGFSDGANDAEIAQAHSNARIAAGGVWYQPGTAVFDSAYNAIVNNSDLQSGSKFVDKSALQHIEAQYNFDFDFADVIAGATFRRYDPQSFGSIFSDTLVNPADTLPDGSANLDADFFNISSFEVGGFVQASKRFLDDRLRLIASIRFDKNQNFDAQFSPRGAIVFTQGKHTVRVSGQSAFRTPTLQNQYIYLNLGPIRLVGNINGYDNLYTQESVESFLDTYDSTFVVDPSILQALPLAPIQPEQVRTIELGYRTTIGEDLFIDLVGYYNSYKNFIGDVRVYQPLGGAQVGEETGPDAVLTGNVELLQIPTNAQQTVSSYGGSIGLAYYIGKGISTTANYTFADINLNNVDDPIIPGFNTPKHKVNIGLQGNKVVKGFGFNTHFRWQDGFFWQSSFGDGDVPAYQTLDVQLNYVFTKWNTTLRVGSSNVIGQEYRTAYGSPLIGRLIYGSLTFNFDKL